MENKFYIYGNWKMNPATVNDAKKLAKDISKKVPSSKFVEVGLCVPGIYLAQLSKEVKGKYKYGIQNIYQGETGAHTGSISAKMAVSVGAKHTIIGHSEVRKSGVTNIDISLSMKEAIKNDLTPILCVGENTRDPNGFYFTEVKEQIESAFSQVPKTRFKDVIIAYEPVWAIGEKAVRVATEDEFIEMKIFIQKVLSDISNRKTADEVSIIYGGSADDTNMMPYLKAGARGFLLGRASLDAEVFSKIVLQIIEYAKNEKH